ncbi:cyclic nucleotide gated channel beta 1 [Paragonimus westermani]|uniref:Cyclic nucleotide gated channel beta 1 n=1 Tax=Paragonimus westermani TaxID=34504 RepID=A0A5J4NF67_9TREM|nr:cyclic nucleotide gated channel beta 1 [Paragonimus westermani]
MHIDMLYMFQIIDILDSANANKVNYRRIMDATLSCMHHLHAPVHVVDKVRKWFLYNWEQQKTFDVTGSHHLTKGISNCERALIYDMILKLKPVVFLPMDYICRKGEVGKEMYIVKSGVVEVVGGPNNSIVFVTLKEGTVFGEISLLALSGKNRRTADVRSQGFSTLFSLSKEDFEEIMKNYPQAHQILKKRSQRMLNRDKKKAREEEKARKAQQQAEQEAMGLHTEDVMEVIVERPPTPRLLETVVQVLEASCPENPITQELRRKSTRNSLELRQFHCRRISTSPSQLGRLYPTKGVSKLANKEQVCL